jgi:hypothetical protein
MADKENSWPVDKTKLRAEWNKEIPPFALSPEVIRETNDQCDALFAIMSRAKKRQQAKKKRAQDHGDDNEEDGPLIDMFVKNRLSAIQRRAVESVRKYLDLVMDLPTIKIGKAEAALKGDLGESYDKKMNKIISVFFIFGGSTIDEEALTSGQDESEIGKYYKKLLATLTHVKENPNVQETDMDGLEEGKTVRLVNYRPANL